ncbi:biotin transporter BioY [Paracoccus aerodenitrificans]|uniref:biotin transporter BioY n=1 Tax=Paracoccus aerodenitrificans TaxID=3017781 RepID=UPI0022F13C53|nr:biotin transporter BioY [Paracoccus aerodenitrificans]WBU62633.1 biotin transporter BioY [Paracoccus aerodenitrificans]
MTFTQAAIPSRSLLTNAVLVLAGTMLVAFSAQVSVPMFPVPMTLQTLAISLIGLTYGSRLAAVTLIAYLAEGAMGLPVFSNGGAGPVYMMGPTSGFLFGFVGMAWLTGFMVERGFDRGFLRLFAAAIIPGMLLFVPGVVALKAVTGLDWQAAMMAGMVPFLIGGVVKAAIAAMAVKAGWSLLNRR